MELITKSFAAQCIAFPDRVERALTRRETVARMTAGKKAVRIPNKAPFGEFSAFLAKLSFQPLGASLPARRPKVEMDNTKLKMDMLDALSQLAEAKAKLTHHRTLHGSSRPKMGLYFIACGDVVKIGKAVDVNARIKILQTGCPAPISVVAWFDNAGHREGDLHKRLSHLRVSGEWFRNTEEVAEVIKELKDVSH